MMTTKDNVSTEVRCQFFKRAMLFADDDDAAVTAVPQSLISFLFTFP